VSCFEQIDGSLGTSPKNTKFSRKALKSLFHSHTKTYLQVLTLWYLYYLCGIGNLLDD